MNDFNKFSFRGILSFCAIMLLFPGAIFAQDCKVLKESIFGTYDGECKKGLAQGKGTAKGTDTYTGDFKKGLPDGNGTYTWADGSVYKGEFKNGMMDGAGELTGTAVGTEGNIITGYWEEDKYLGTTKEAYYVHRHSSEVRTVRVTEVKKPKEEDKKAVFVTITEKGANLFDQNISVDVSVGRHSRTQKSGMATKIEVVIFPYRATLNYQGKTVDIEFYREGTYNVAIDLI